jgi:FkbM family methyltransferase
MKHFHEDNRYSYQLGSQSLCVDVGAFMGEWSRKIGEKYGCRVIAFEPALEHFSEAVCNCMGLPNVMLINSAVSAGGAVQSIGVSGDSTGQFSKGASRQVSVVKAVPMVKVLGRIDVLKLNCEGAEFEILDILINSGLHTQLQNIQVQFHKCVPEWEARHKSICERLSQTHEQEWDSLFTWENYKLR